MSDSPFSSVCRWLGAAGPIVTTFSDMTPTTPATAGGVSNPIMDEEDARKADLLEVMTFRDLCLYFKRSPNATRGIIKRLGIRPTAWTEGTRVRTYLRKDLYDAVQGGGRASKAFNHSATARNNRRAAR